MRPTLILVALIAVVALVFAIWPAVADAPWETEVIVITQPAPEVIPTEDDTRCRQAIVARDRIRRSNQGLERITSQFIEEDQRRLDQAQDDVDLFC